MITEIKLENFRSIENAEIKLGKINILTGSNSSGKSSILYGLLALKNTIGNPNQSIDGCLTLPYMNLGGFTQVVFDKNVNKRITLGIENQSENNNKTSFWAHLGKNESELNIKTNILPGGLKLPVTFPYPANKTTGTEKQFAEDIIFTINWNGISANLSYKKLKEDMPDDKVRQYTEDLNIGLNSPAEALRTVDFIPLKHGRGFTQPVYTSMALSNDILEETQIATLLAQNRDLEGKVSHYLGKITNKSFSVRPILGTGNFYLQTHDKNTGFVSDLVNEGFGINQLIAVLTKILRPDVRFICIEELEIHLHPGLMKNLVEVLIDISEEEDKQFLISTHSEHIILPLLNKVAEGKIKPEDITIYFLEKDRKRTTYKLQNINSKGQIEGGLKSFYDTELAEVEQFFKARE